MTQVVFKIWACPTEGCGNYYASSSQDALDLTAEAVLESDMRHSVDSRPARDPKVVQNRGECPNCRTRGRGRVQRVPKVLVVEVDAVESPVPPPGADAAAWAAAHPGR